MSLPDWDFATWVQLGALAAQGATLAALIAVGRLMARSSGPSDRMVTSGAARECERRREAEATARRVLRAIR